MTHHAIRSLWRTALALCGVTTLTLFLILSDAYARPVQIIHTNDLHSFLEQGDHPTRGGYAAVKATIETIRRNAQEQGIETIVLDGGDFSEGSEFFLADEGRESWKIMDEMGFDAVTIGNHDWLIGTAQMDGILGTVRPKTPFLGANLQVDSKYKNFAEYIKPYVELKRSGLKIAVLGLSTDEFVYRWRIKDGQVASPEQVAREIVPDLRQRNDFVIALTHLGVMDDAKLAGRVPGIDLVVGAHSHTVLKEPLYSKNPSGNRVPIVQTGQHGNSVGDLLVDLEPGQPVKVLHYRLVPVWWPGPRDQKIEERITEARRKLEDRYGREWLYETIGYTDIPMERPLDRNTAWGTIVADSLRETVSADMALDVGEFYGESQPAGPISRETLMQFYPRVFDATKPYGWTVWTIKCPGWLVGMVLDIAFKEGHLLNLSNVTYEIGEDDYGNPLVKNIRIGGKWLNPFKEYSIAVTEGIGRGGLEISALLRLFFDPQDSGVPVWSAMETAVKKQNRSLASTSLP